MNKATTSIDDLVDSFVVYLNGAGFEPKSSDEIPEELRASDAKYQMANWQIRLGSPNPWIQQLEHHLPQKWPIRFTSFVDRYRFCNFVVGPLMFFANTGCDLFYELSSRALKDKKIYPILHRHGFLQFGLPQETNYDPVCFDMQRRSSDDAPIVQVDHEEILLRGRIRIVGEIALSFADFIRRAIAETYRVR